jgi:hypothetical protein
MNKGRKRSEGSLHGGSIEADPSAGFCSSATGSTVQKAKRALLPVPAGRPAETDGRR